MIPKMLLLLFIIGDWCTMITNSPCSRLWKEKVARRYSRRRARSQGGRSEGGRGGNEGRTGGSTHGPFELSTLLLSALTLQLRPSSEETRN